MKHVDSITFEALFFDSTRAQLNWHRLRREQWTAGVCPVVSRAALGDLRLPWTRRRTLMEKGASQFTVATAARRLHKLPSDRRNAILTLAQSFSDGRSQVLALPAVRTNDTHLLLDGCHRAVALYLAEKEPTVALFVLNAPADAGTIIDLELTR